jgi:hypothetical protein
MKIRQTLLDAALAYWFVSCLNRLSAAGGDDLVECNGTDVFPPWPFLIACKT